MHRYLMIAALIMTPLPLKSEPKPGVKSTTDGHRVPQMPPAKGIAQRPTPSLTKATLVVFWQGGLISRFLSGGARTDILIDEIRVGSLAQGEFLTLAVSPVEHRLKLQYGIGQTIDLLKIPGAKMPMAAGVSNYVEVYNEGHYLTLVRRDSEFGRKALLSLAKR